MSSFGICQSPATILISEVHISKQCFSFTSPPMNSINVMGTFFFFSKCFRLASESTLNFKSAFYASLSSMSKRKYCQSSLTSSHTGHESSCITKQWGQPLYSKDNVVLQVWKQQSKGGVFKITAEGEQKHLHTLILEKHLGRWISLCTFIKTKEAWYHWEWLSVLFCCSSSYKCHISGTAAAALLLWSDSWEKLWC